MDTSAEEAALASISQMLYEQEKLLSGFERADALAAAALQSTWDARKTEGELRASIASKQVRAAADGVVAGVYAGRGRLCSGAFRSGRRAWRKPLRYSRQPRRRSCGSDTRYGCGYQGRIRKTAWTGDTGIHGSSPGGYSNVAVCSDADLSSIGGWSACARLR